MSKTELVQPYSGETSGFFDMFLKFRYPIALIFFVFLVVFKINGSNLSFWNNYIDISGQNSNTIVGQARGIRSDEWEVLMPIYFSQQNSGTPFSAVNPNITQSGQNVIITLDAPINDIFTISKPLHWGFLFLSPDYALAWYWNLKFILILLLSYELCMIITRRNKFVSVIGAVWITLSPAVQWWFAQHVGDNVLYAEAMIVTFYYYLKYFRKLPLKIIFASLFSLSCLGFVTPLYPAVQVPFGFLTLLFMALIFSDFRKELKFEKKDIAIIGIAAVCVAAILVHLYFLIKNALPLMTNTVYPGKRISTGGDGKDFNFYSYLTNIFIPFIPTNIANSNESELASFYNFLPAIVFALPVVIARHLKNPKKFESTKYGIALTLYSAFFAIYMSFSILPPIVAKITLLSFVTGQRAMLAYAYSAMLLSIWALSEFSRKVVVSRLYAFLIALFVAGTYLAMLQLTALQGTIQLRYYLIVIVVASLLNILLLRGCKKTFSVIMAGVIFASGATVNPINVGAGAVIHSNISTEIRNVESSDKNSNWIAVDNDIGGAMDTLIYANGAKSLGGINNYPDYAKWSVIDPTGKFKDIYNRSAHVSFRFTGRKTYFTYIAANTFIVNLNVNDLEKMHVNYIVSKENLVSFDNSDVQFQMLFNPDSSGYTIYKVSYSS